MELKTWLDRYPAAPRPAPGIPEKPDRALRSARWLAWTAAAALFLIVGFWLWSTTQPPFPPEEPIASDLFTSTPTAVVPLPTTTPASTSTTEPDAATTQPPAPSPQPSPLPASAAPTAQPLATLTPISSDQRAAHPLLFARQGTLWRVSLDGGSEARLTADNVFKWLLDTRFLAVLLAQRPELYQPIPSPDGRYLVWGETQSGSLRLLDLTTGELRWLPTPGSPPAVWSADGRLLAYSDHTFRRATGDDLYLYDMTSGEVVQALSLPQDEHSFGLMNLVWSPDNSEIAFTCCFQAHPRLGLVGKIARLHLETGAFETTTGQIETSIGNPPPPICWTAENVAGARQVVSRLLAEDILHCSSTSPNFPAVSADGLVRVSSYLQPVDGVLEHWLRVESSEGTLLWEKQMPADRVVRDVNRVYWSPDGSMLFLDDSLTISPIWRIPADGSGDWEMVVADGYLLGILPEY